ncbi:MAG: TonB-dependent receptor, partial [Vicingaceae bacterium]
PIDLAATRANSGRTVLLEDDLFSQRYEDYFHRNIKFGFQLSEKKRKVSHKFSIDFQNILNTDNGFKLHHNQVTNKIKSVPQIGFFPDVLYRIKF